MAMTASRPTTVIGGSCYVWRDNSMAAMQVIWDVVGKRITVICQDKVVTLPGKFASQKDGVEAGEEHCRKLGWKSDG
jgi:hypothetical protein